MAIVRWEPLREFSTLQNEMNRLFNSVFDTPPTGGNGGAMRRWMPAMDLAETDEDFVLRADLPGLSEDDVKIELEDSTLTISGERKSEHEDKGEALLAEARRTHLDGVRERFLQHFEPDELRTLAALWERVLPGASGS